MISLGARVDALTLAFRVRLDFALVARLKACAEVAREHGRAAFEWHVEEPETEMGGSTERRLGPHRARWANDFDRVRRKSAIWGEMSYSKQRGVWRITNEPYFRIQIQENAPGGGTLRTCKACRGHGWHAPTFTVWHHEQCKACEGLGVLEEPGWTFEIIWYAQELAARGLEHALAESHAIASIAGEVLEARLRRIDLCADVQGWDISADDVKRIAKRPRARWAVDDDGPRAPRPMRCPRTGVCAQRCTCADVQAYGSGSTIARRRITGISIGRGGALMARIYDKRVELENDRVGARREAEESRWTRAGWDGVSSVSRVEFQIRGVALTELGVRDPDACVVPIYRRETFVDARGRTKLRAVVAGEQVLTANDNGREVQATIVHRLEAIWRTCLDWIRLVVPQATASGKAIAVSRLKDDPRWELLRKVRFRETDDEPIRRYRPRAAASSAQALGVALSGAGRAGTLEHLPEGKEHYDDDDTTERALRSRVGRLFASTADGVTDWLLERFGGPANAAVHFAVRSNASRARFLAGIDAPDRTYVEDQRTEPLLAAQ